MPIWHNNCAVYMRSFSGTPGPHYALGRTADRERVRALDLPQEVVTFTDFGAPLLDLLRTLRWVCVPG